LGASAALASKSQGLPVSPLGPGDSQTTWHEGICTSGRAVCLLITAAALGTLAQDITFPLRPHSLEASHLAGPPPSPSQDCWHAGAARIPVEWSHRQEQRPNYLLGWRPAPYQVLWGTRASKHLWLRLCRTSGSLRGSHGRRSPRSHWLSPCCRPA
jgi:hypothetical protein